MITRRLRISMPQEFLRFLHPDESLNSLMARKLRGRGFWMPVVSYSWGNTYDGKWLSRDHFSVAHAQSAKAAIERYYPQLEVAYEEDQCGGLPQIAREDAKADHWLAPRPFEAAVAAVFGAIAVWVDIAKGKSPDDKKQ